MKALRIYGCVAAISLSALLGACGTEYGAGAKAGPTSSDSTPVSVPTEQSTLASHPCSTDCGVADEPVGLATDGPVACSSSADIWALVDDSEGTELADRLVSDCDYRVTGEACEEDELCALAEIWATSSFTGHGMR